MKKITPELIQQAYALGNTLPWDPDCGAPELYFPTSNYYRPFQALTQIAQPEITVELGTCGGGAAFHLAKGYPEGKVYTVDIDYNSHTRTVDRALDRCPNLHFMLDDSIEVAAKFAEQSVGIIFVDTTHTYHRTLAEYLAWKDKLKPEGVFIFDDIRRPRMREAMDEIGGKELYYP